MNHYKTLKIGDKASQNEIRESFRKLAKKWHPDSNPENIEESTEQFKKINEAYEILGNIEKRKKYDNRKNLSVFSDFFSSKIEDIGSNIRSIVEITLEEVSTGTIKTINIKRLEICNNCSSDKTIEGTCSECLGKKVLWYSRDVEILVPIGVSNGDIIRIKDNGNFGKDGHGDLIVFIYVKKHERFNRVSKTDISTSVRIPLKLSLCGGKIPLKGLSGEDIIVNVPRSCSNGNIIKVDGSGIKGGGLYISIFVDIPILTEDVLEKISKMLP